MKEISSIEKYISHIMRIKKKYEDLGLGEYQWFFRGQKDSTWMILPNVFRDGKLKSEYITIQNAVRQNPFEFKQLTEFETLTKLQHYGLGTRLLDVTLNPLVALYFATEPAISYEKGGDKRYKLIEKDGVVFYQYSPWHSLNELCVRIAMALPFINFDSSTTINTLLKYMRENAMISENEMVFLQQDDFEQFVNYIQKNYFVVSSYSNDRLIRQSGAFVLPTAIKIHKEPSISLGDQIIEKSFIELNSEFVNDVLVIPSKYKSKIREQLDFFNINEATLFPELEHQMTYVQGKQSRYDGSSPSFEPFVQEKEDIVLQEYNKYIPDIEKIVLDIIPDVEYDVRTKIINDIKDKTSFIDWKSKEQIRSQVRLGISRTLQEKLSARLSKEYAEKILKLLLTPVGQYIMKTGD